MAARVVRLYRRATGWSWWLQFGRWSESWGIMSQLRGKGRREFYVESEQPYRTHEEAEREMAGWCRCPGKCRVHGE